MNRTALVVVAHADDVTLFIGGTVRRWADEGWTVVVVRVTDDATDSVGFSRAETIERNGRELRIAMGALGVAEVIDLGYPTDTLADVPELELRERFIRLTRELRPYALVSFDPYGAFHEDNQDHIAIAAAVDETAWTAMFDKHHPEHRAEGLEPHGVFERWYFARDVVQVTTPVDITSTIDRKVEAALCHDTMLRHLVHQLRLQARTAGREVAVLEQAQDGDLRPLVDAMLRHQAAAAGRRHGFAYAEEFRMVRFGGFDALLDDT